MMIEVSVVEIIGGSFRVSLVIYTLLENSGIKNI